MSSAPRRRAGVHHIAFRAADAAAAVDAAASRAAPLLDIPENYYEDLGARFGLDDADTVALAARHLLYDRDAAGGTFLHAYTHAFRDRFFLEILSRAGGYSGYGAANAPFRMAAQRRHGLKDLGGA